MSVLKIKGESKMLELRTYTRAELEEILQTHNRQSMTRKLTSYGVEFTCEGNASNLKITINAIHDPFKVLCILELGFSPQCDFVKMREFFWYYLQDEEFRSFPDEVLENRMRDKEHPVSRQTIARWRGYLSRNLLFSASGTEFMYYFAYQGEQQMTSKEQYSAAWREYWANKEQGMNSRDAIWEMICHYGGVARKQPIMEMNGIFAYTLIPQMIDYIQESIENDLEKFKQQAV